jgi:hydrogenase maturation protein HypF
VEARAPVLACGGALKATFCLATGRRAWVSHHIGDLENLETLTAYRDGVAHFETLFDVTPEVVAHDLHPDYLSTAYALERAGVRLEAVQHHHAHLAAVLAEHGETGPAVGAIYDGAGLGADGTVWGGELLAGGLATFARAGHLLTVPQPGGDRAARQGWRMACAWLAAAGLLEEDPPAALRGAVAPAAWRAVSRMAGTGLAAPATSSVGRLFDAVAALSGVRSSSTYEGQAAIELEARADPAEPGHYAIPVDDELVLDARPAIRAVLRDAARGLAASVISARFHRGLAEATARACAELARRTGTTVVVLGGGVWANRRLLEATVARLEDRDLRVLVPERLPPGDGGLSYGQAAVAAARS